MLLCGLSVSAQGQTTTETVTLETLPVAPTPTAKESEIINVFSDHYNSPIGVTMGTMTDGTSAGSVVTNNSGDNFVYVENKKGGTLKGILFKEAIDVTKYDILHFDVYAVTGGTNGIRPRITLADADEKGSSTPRSYAGTIGTATVGKWTSYNLSITTLLSKLGTVPDKTKLKSLWLYDNAGGARTFYVDNIYFKKSAVQANILDREFTKDYVSTICLPFDLSADELSSVKGTVYEFSNESDGTLTFAPVSSLSAYVPYVFKASETGCSFSDFSGKTLASGDPETVTKGDFSFVGTKEDKNLVSTSSILYYGFRASDGVFVKAGTSTGVNISPYRCYLYTTKADAQAKSSVFLSNETTAIRNLNAAGVKNNIVYNLNGVIVSTKGITSSLPKGIYIYNNHKIVVK